MKSRDEKADYLTVPADISVDLPVIILCHPRSGSHYLASLLELNGYSYGDEVFWIAVRRGPIQSLDDLVRSTRKSRLPNSALIVHGYQVRKLTSDNEVDFLNACFAPCRYIHLSRNVLDSAASWCIADAQKWFKSWNKPAVLYDNIPYSFIMVARSVNWIRESAWSEETIAKLNAYPMTYEELTQRRNATLRRLYAHTGIAISQTENGRAEKQIDSRKAEFIERFKKDLPNIVRADLPADLTDFKLE